MILQFSCIIFTGKGGTYCEVILTTGCSSSPCLHGATCVSRATGEYSCVCFQGYTGQHCEMNIDDCVNNDCEAYQVCTDLVNGYRFVVKETTSKCIFLYFIAEGNIVGAQKKI